MDPVQVKMLGEFSIRAGDTVISDVGTRSKKVWGLLAYLLCTRDRVSSQQKLMDLLWGKTMPAPIRKTLCESRCTVFGLCWIVSGPVRAMNSLSEKTADISGVTP